MPQLFSIILDCDKKKSDDKLGGEKRKQFEDLIKDFNAKKEKKELAKTSRVNIKLKESVNFEVI